MHMPFAGSRAAVGVAVLSSGAKSVMAVCLAVLAGTVFSYAGLAQTGGAQAGGAVTSGAVTSEAASVPRLIKYSGALVDGRGYPITTPVEVTFSLYERPAVEEQTALWQETQTVTPDEAGGYTVYLGAATAQGLPAGVFAAVTAQYLGVKAQGYAEQGRTLLVSVPYALKAGDAQTLGGLPASAYALAGSQAAPRAAVTPVGVSPDTATTVTTTGGATGYLSEFSGESTIVDSPVFVSGANVGIGTTAPVSALDVVGTTTLAGPMNLTAQGTATASAGEASQQQSFTASTYNSSVGEPVTQTFAWQAVPVGNDTASAAAAFDLLYASGSNTPAATGLSVASTGVVTFATGQTFPGTSTITDVAAGAGLTGGGTTGKVTLGLNTAQVPLLASANTFTASQTITGNITIGGSISIGGQFKTGTAALGTTSTGNLTALAISSSGDVKATGALEAVPAVTATATNGGGGSTLQLGASVYNSSSKAVVSPYFQWEAAPTGNDTASPGAQLGLNYYSGAGSVAATGLTINPTGVLHFASGQTFPGTGDITGITTSSPLTGSGTSGSVALGLDTSALETTLNGKYAQLGVSNTFTANQYVIGTFFVDGPAEATSLATTSLLVNPSGSNDYVSYYGLEAYSASASTAQIGTVSGGSDAAIAVNNTASGGREYWIDSGSGNAGVGAGNFAIYDSTAGETRMVVAANGAVGIGTSIPAAELEVDSIPSVSSDAIYGFGGYYGPAAGQSTGYGTVGITGAGGDTDNSAGSTGGNGANFYGGSADTAADSGYGLYAEGGYGATTGVQDSALFQNDISVNGHTVSDVSSTKIDHPSDPANKYLNHAAVQSSELMNLYTGNITTDAEGHATVKLPEWFEAENADFRYQLTVIGQFAQAIVKDKIANGQFTIMTNNANVEVSWQVTAVRQDAYAKAHPLVVEEAKPAKEVGFYRHPELYGQPKEKQTEWGRHPIMMARMQAQRAAKASKPVAAPTTVTPRVGGVKPVLQAAK